MELQELKEIMKIEGNLKAFEYKGYSCCILRGPAKNLNGYVAVTKDSKFYGKDYDSIDVNIHGGLTFSGHNGPRMNFPQSFEDKWAIGFDCAHLNDLVPQFLELGLGLVSEGDVCRTMEYVQSELEKLVDQLIKLEVS